MKRLISLCVIVFQTILSYAQPIEYAQRVAHYDAAAVFTSGSAGIFNNSTNEVGMYANSSGSKQVVAWRRFKTNGDNTGSNMELAVGSEFKITVAAKRAYGRIGVALLSSPTVFGSWANREENAAISVNLDGPAYTGSGYGSWYIKTGTTQAATFGGEQDNYRDYTITFLKTAANKMNVTITNNNGATSTFTDVTLSNSSAITHYAIYMQDDWSGNAQSNIFWKAPVALPIIINELNGTIINKITSLTWATASEANIANYAVERSRDSRSWETIGNVAAKNAANGADYSFNDNKVVAGTTYYRIRIEEYSGAVTYSKVVSVKSGFGTLSAYPNPVKSVLTIETGSNTEGGMFEVVDIAGRTVLQQNMGNQLDVSALNAGVYQLKMIDKAGQTLQQVRFVKE